MVLSPPSRAEWTDALHTQDFSTVKSPPSPLHPPPLLLESLFPSPAHRWSAGSRWQQKAPLCPPGRRGRWHPADWPRRWGEARRPIAAPRCSSHPPLSCCCCCFDGMWPARPESCNRQNSMECNWQGRNPVTGKTQRNVTSKARILEQAKLNGT